eukprot:COSAG01_NODE_6375_length_3705_cov_2.301442_2_plen_88_part_00
MASASVIWRIITSLWHLPAMPARSQRSLQPAVPTQFHEFQPRSGVRARPSGSATATTAAAIVITSRHVTIIARGAALVTLQAPGNRL